jgi:hypothetical protein
MRTRALIVTACLFAFACGGDTKSVSQMLKVWKAAGLEPSAFQKAQTKLGGTCQAGTVNGVDTILCEFKDASAAKEAEPKGLEIVGETTGASLAKGRMLLVVADRKNADPNGKHIQQITKSFRQ